MALDNAMNRDQKPAALRFADVSGLLTEMGPENTDRKWRQIAVTYTASQFHGVYRGKKHHDEDFDQVLARAKSIGCHKVILTTMNILAIHENLEVCIKYPDHCFMTIGVHPYHAHDLYSAPNMLEKLSALINSISDANSSCLVAFGEIGLDYHYLDKADKEVQKRAFRDQLEISTKLNLPLFLHVRDSYEDFVTLIKPFLSRLPLRGIVHSFAGNREEMQGLVELGFDISVNGVSFNTLEQLEMVRGIPLDRLQLETDAPWCEVPTKGPVTQYLQNAPPLPPARKPKDFVTGQMVRGRNESCFIDRVARIVAGIKGLSIEEVADAAWQNTNKMFRLGNTAVNA